MQDEKESKPRKPYPVVNDKCNGCGTCVNICPMDVFSLENGKAVVKNPSACIGCHACDNQCPMDAISLEEE